MDITKNNEQNKKTPVTTAPRKRKKRGKRHIFRKIMLVILLIILACFLAVGVYVLVLSRDLPQITIDDLITSQTSFVYDDSKTQIASLHGGENRISVDLDEIPQHLIDAVIASEDIRFYEHHGVDFRSVARAVVVDLIDTIRAKELTFTQGASTITMQLVRNVIDERDKKIERKVKEALLAIQFEKNYEKDEILYYYLNEIYLGPQIYGVQAASQYYFGKDVSDISLAEAATLVAIIRNPGYYSPYSHPERTLNVRNSVLNCMIDYDEATYGVSAEAAKAEPVVAYEEDEETAQYDYPWFVDYVIEEASDIMIDLGLDETAVYTAGLKIYTTLDVDVQQAIELVYADDSYFPESSTLDLAESAMVIMSPKGEIKGLVGGRRYTTRRGFNRATDLERSPGSTIKPIVTYGPAIELGYGSGYVIDDWPLAGSYSPYNDDYTFMGRITLRTAVMRSRNVAAVRMLDEIGVETGWEYGLKMGLPLVESDKGLALTLGGLTYGVSPLDMAGAYATFANAGVYTKPYCITRIENAKDEVLYTVQPEYTEVFSEETAYIMTDVLTSAVNGGTGTNARISGWQVAGKTGTNGLPREDPDYRGKSGNKDAWFCGYTTALVGAVWMGYDNKFDAEDNLQYLRAFGSTYPARLFSTVMSAALSNGGYPNEKFTRPEDVVSLTVDTKAGGSPSSLTPSSYIGSELYRKGDSLRSDGTTWEQVEICKDTGMLAGKFCFNRESRVFLSWDGKGDVTDSVISRSAKTKDYSLYVPLKTCTTHKIDWNIPGLDDPNNNGQGGHNGGKDDDDDKESDDNDIAPNTPTGLSAVSGSGGVYVSWKGNNSSSDIVYVLEKTNSSSGEKQRYSLFGTEYFDENVSNDISYVYQVYAYDKITTLTSSWSVSAVVLYTGN